MSITLAKIANNTASVTFAVGEDSVTVVYRPARLTERVYGQLQRWQNLSNDTIEDGFAALNDILVQMVKSWDVYEDDGVTMFPLDVERLADLPISFRGQVLNAILGDIRPN